MHGGWSGHRDYRSENAERDRTHPIRATILERRAVSAVAAAVDLVAGRPNAARRYIRREWQQHDAAIGLLPTGSGTKTWARAMTGTDPVWLPGRNAIIYVTPRDLVAASALRQAQRLVCPPGDVRSDHAQSHAPYVGDHEQSTARAVRALTAQTMPGHAAASRSAGLLGLPTAARQPEGLRYGRFLRRALQLGMLQMEIRFCLERVREQQNLRLTEELARQVQRSR